MSETLKAADLNRNHLGQMLRVNIDQSEVKDILRGVNHEADIIHEPRVCDEIGRYALGRASTIITFLHSGEVRVLGNADVEIVEL